MAVVVLLLIVGAVAAGAYFVARSLLRRRRTPRKLRGEWWTAFEREFDAYARAVASQRRRGERGSAGR